MPAAVPSWGWHRLADDWAVRLVERSGVRPGEQVIDLGAGDGALTGPLVAAGARVLAVELHAGRAATLRRRFPTVTVVELDARDFRLPQRPFRIVASPPYALSSPLLAMLFTGHNGLYAADLLLQRAVTSRAVQRVPRRFSARRGMTVPRSAFRPRPRVDSSVLVVRRR